MKKNIFYLLAAAIIVILAVAGFFAYKKYFTPQKTHYHAGFVVFENGKKLDFSANKYMFVKPCTLTGKEEDSDSDIQIEKAHLHDNVGDLVHIERTGAVWRDLFTNIKFSIDYSKAKGFINNKEVQNFQNQQIKPFDSLVVFLGSMDPKLLSQAVTKDYIEKMAKKSVGCGD